MAKLASEFTLPLSLLREEIASGDLLPPVYLEYRPLIADVLCFFLERLPARRLRRIFDEQVQMPTSTSLAGRLVALFHHVPTMHKLGQVLARDRRLDPNFRRKLQELESLEPRTSAAAFSALLEREFRGWKKASIKLGTEALAEGSVAIVMPFICKGADGRENEEGVFKLLKPAIEQRLTEDLEIWGDLGQFLEEDCEHYHLPKLDYRGTFETVRELLLHEVRLDEEQENLAEAAKEYVEIKSVVIPALLPFGLPRLTAMQRLHGKTLSERLRERDSSHPALGGLSTKKSTDVSALQMGRSSTRENRLFEKAGLLSGLAPVIGESLIAHSFFSSRPGALFHADPHPGNLFITTDGRLGLLDWSLVGRLRKEQRIQLVDLLIGAATLDPARLQQVVEKLANGSLEKKVAEQILEGGLRELRWGTFPGVGWLTRLLDNLVLEARARFNGDLLLFRKSLLVLEGLLADLSGIDERASENFLDRALLAKLAEQLVFEWPERFRQPMEARTFQSHCSTADLLSLLCSGPAIWARYWGGAWRDLAQLF